MANWRSWVGLLALAGAFAACSGDGTGGEGGDGGSTGGEAGGSGSGSGGSASGTGGSTTLPGGGGETEPDPELCIECFTGTVYYVAADGDDEAAGTSPETAWRSIDHINQAEFSPGDAVLFRRGDVWRDELVISWSGTSDEPITFAYYGDEADKPALYGSAAVTQWTSVADNIWQSDPSQQLDDPSRGAPHDGQTKGDSGWPGAAYFVATDGGVTWGWQEKEIGSSFDALERPYDWGFRDGSVYVYSEVDPATVYSAFEVSQRPSSISMPDGDAQNWVVIEGLDLRYTQSKGVFSGYPHMEAEGLTIRNCHVGWVGIKDGMAADCLKVWHSDAVYEDNVIHDCGRHGLGILTFDQRGVNVSDVLIARNTFYNSWHTTGVDVQVNGDVIERVTLDGNLITGDPSWDVNAEEGHHSMGVYTAAYSGTLGEFSFINNVFAYCHGKCLTIGAIDGLQVANNTFYGVNPSVEQGGGQLYMSGEFTSATVTNNLFFNDSDTSVNPYYRSVHVTESSAGELEMDYNLYSTVDPGADIVRLEPSISYEVEDWSSYRTATGWDEHGVVTDDIDLVDAPADLHPTASSPAAGAGIVIAEVTQDREETPRADPPSIGAYEVP